MGNVKPNKKERYALFELEPKVAKMIDKEKKDNGVNKDFTVNKAIEFFFANRTKKTKFGTYDYEFSPKGRKAVYIYISLKSAKLLNVEKTKKEVSYNRIINTAIKFYIKNK